MKISFIIYADLQRLFEKMSTCHNNPEKTLTTEKNKHIAFGYSLFRCSFDATSLLIMEEKTV